MEEVNCLPAKTSGYKSLLLFFFAFTLISCERQDSLSLTIIEQQGAQNFALHKIHFTDTDNGLAMGGDEYQYGIAQTTQDGGLTWSLDTVSQKSVFDFDVVEDTICSSGVRGYITYKELDSPWLETRPSEPMNANGIVKLEGGGYIVVGGVGFQRGYIMKLSNSLAFVDKKSYPGELNAITQSDNKTLHAVGYGGIYRSVDAGSTWLPNAQVGDNYRDIHFVNERVGYIVGHSGSILKSEDAGATWQELNKPSAQNKLPFNGVHFIDETDGVVVGDDGLVWATTDGGFRWSVVEDLPGYNFNAVFMQENVTWLTTQEGHIIRLFL